jgi:hypothetical protein
MRLVRLSLLFAALAATSTASATATPAKPCWERVIADWTNGSVQSSYKAACYAKALKRLPTDVRMYSDAGQEIRRAMLAAIRHDDPPPPASSGKAATASESAAAGQVDPKSRKLPLPILFAITLVLTLVAVGVVGRVRARRNAQQRIDPLEQ